MKRLRTLLATGCLVVGAGTAAVAVSPNRAIAAGTLDVYNVKANAAPIEIAIKTGYSFVVYPDAQMPRATTFIEGGQVSSIASPADPGDNADALAGLLAPQGESAIASAMTDPHQLGQFPSPFKDVFAAVAKLIPVVAAYNTKVTTPYEHVQANYPTVDSTGKTAGAQTAAFGTDPQVADPTGTFAVQAAAGKAFADKNVGIADAGAGAEISIPALNLSIGRVSSHSEVHGFADKATADAVSTVQNLTLVNFPGVPAIPSAPALPGVPQGNLPLLHIDSIVATVHTERVAGAGSATGTKSVRYGGVTVLGQPATIDDKGITLVTANQGLGPVIAALNQLFGAAKTVNGHLPPGLPLFGGSQTVIPEGTLAGPILNEAVSHSNNEDAAAVSGLTLTLDSTILVPSQTQGAIPPDPKNLPTLVPSPVRYTVTLATANSSAYGYSFPSNTFNAPSSVAPLDLGSSALGSGSSDLGGAGGGGGAGAGAGAGGAGAGANNKANLANSAPAYAWFDPARLGKGAVVALGTIAELFMLGALLACYRMSASRRLSDAAKTDLNFI
jgi:hypothetical protein